MQSADIHALHGSLRQAASVLLAVPLQARANAVAAAAHELLDAQTTLGGQLREALLAQGRLTQPVIEYGLHTTLALFERDTLLALYASRCGERRPCQAVVILAGNVFSAAARPLLFPLLCGCAVLAKAATADDVLPRYLQRALCAADPRLGAACAVIGFDREQRDLERALLHDVELVSVYGSDATIAELAQRLGPGTRLVAHGHGLGAMYIAREALPSESAARALAARAAYDVAAYDQRGCLSPHVAMVEPGGAVDARGFARLLGEALESTAADLPRGTLAEHGAQAELQWRGVAAAIGELLRGQSWAVSYEAHCALRPSPGFRNIAVYDCVGVAELQQRIAPLGQHLKALGIAGASTRRALTSLCPYVCPIGKMQTPPIDAPLDGLHPLHGYCSD